MPKKNTRKTKNKNPKPIHPPKKKRLSINPELILIITAIIIFSIALIIRIFAFDTPIMGDEATYSILGKKSISGQTMFVDFYEMKPPLLYYCYGIGSLIFSWSDFGLRALGFFLVLLNSSLLFLLIKRYASLGISMLGAACGFFFMNNIYTYATETVSEHFMISFVLGGFVLLTSSRKKNRNLIIFLSGFLIVGGALIKQTAAVYGLGALIWIIIQSFNDNNLFNRKDFLKNIGLLGAGALAHIILMFLPILISGSWEEARYWLIDFPSSYTSKVEWNEGSLYFRTFLGRAIKYQITSFLFFTFAFLLTFSQYKKKYFSIALILLICSFLNAIPGLRFYGQYWIPLFIILPFGILGFKDISNALLKKAAIFVIPLSILLVLGTDVINKQKEYFEKGYMLNTEKAHNGNYPSVLYALLNDLEKRMGPEDSFYMLGSQTQSYLALNRFPNHKHIYPKLIGRDTEKNAEFQRESFEELQAASPDFVIFSVVGVSWRGSGTHNDYFYNRAFNYVVNNYDPIWIFNYDERRYYNMENGENGDLYKTNQLISFKRRYQ